MKKVKKIDLEEIFDQIKVRFKPEDINKFCKDEVVSKLIKKSVKEKNVELYDVFIQNKENIDAEKLLLISYMRGQERSEIIKSELLRKQGTELEIRNLKEELKEIENSLRIIKHKIKGLDIYIVIAIAKEGIIKKIKVISSKEIIYKEKFKDKEKINREIFEEIDKGDLEENVGMSYIIQCLETEDFLQVLPSDIASAVIYRINNNISKICEKQIEQLKQKENNHQINDEESMNLQRYIRENGMIPEARNSIKELFKYIDLERVLLLSIYRFENVLEKESEVGYKLPEQEVIFIKEMAEHVLQYVGKNTAISKDEVEYSYKDIKNLIKRINGNNGIYISKEKIQKSREELLNGSKSLDNIETPVLSLLELNKQEIEDIMCYHIENFAFGVEKLNYTEEQIIEKLIKNPEIISNELLTYLYSVERIKSNSIIQLYAEGLIDAEFFKEFSEETDISSEISLSKINEDYKKIKNNQEKNEADERILNSEIELYKIANLEEKSKDDLQDESNDLMYELAENFEDEKDILFYFENGLITLNTVAEWGGEELVEDLYQTSKITLQDIENLYQLGKLKQSIIEKIILETSPDYSNLINYMKLGYISEEKIIQIYMNGKIFDKDLEELAREGRVSVKSFQEFTLKRTKEQLEEVANIKFQPTLVNIPDRKVHLNLVEESEDNYQTSGYNVNSRTKTLIDPNARYEFLKLLGAKEAIAIIPDEENAFYNYEFFVIPNKEGELDINSVVIAERFYKDKEDPIEFSVDNATYFFQYKDLMVNSNLSKKEIAQEKENVVFTANHRAGSWAVSVLYRIAQTMASSDFKEYKKGDIRAERVINELLKLYSQEELKKILDMARRLDDTNEFIYEEVNSSYSQQRKKNVSNGETDDGEAHGGEANAKKCFDQTDDDQR